MKLLGFVAFLMLAFLAMRGARWAYVAFALMIPLSFFAFTGFHVDPKPCELTFELPLAVQSLSNYPHILLFAFFLLVTTKCFRSSDWPSLGWSFCLTMAMGAAMEIAQGLSGNHHCKSVDLVPDFIGALLGLLAVILGGTIANGKLRRRGRHHGDLRENQTVD
jgi:hypothetical protein